MPLADRPIRHPAVVFYPALTLRGLVERRERAPVGVGYRNRCRARHSCRRSRDGDDALDDPVNQTRLIHGSDGGVARRPCEFAATHRMPVRVPGLRAQAQGVACGHFAEGGQHLYPLHGLRHGHLGAPRGRPGRCADRGGPVANRRDEPRRVHPRHRVADAHPRHGGPAHDPAVLVADLGTQLHGLAYRCQLGRGRAHRDRRRHGNLGWPRRIRRAVTTADDPGDACQNCPGKDGFARVAHGMSSSRAG